MPLLWCQEIPQVQEDVQKSTGQGGHPEAHEGGLPQGRAGVRVVRNEAQTVTDWGEELAGGSAITSG